MINVYLLCSLLLIQALGQGLVSPALAQTQTQQPPAATTPRELTASQLLKQLEATYPPLQITREKVRQNQAKLLEKQGAFDLVLKSKAEVAVLGYYQNIILDNEIRQPTPLWGTDFFAGYRLGVGKIPDYYGGKETLSLGEWRVGMETPLLQNGPIDPRRADILLLEIDIDASELDILNKQLKFAKSALKTYWTWLTLEQKEKVAQELLERARLKVNQLQTEVNVGKTAPIYVTENQRSIFKRQQKLLEIQQEQQMAQQDLRLFLPENSPPWRPPTPPAEPTLFSCEQLPLTPDSQSLQNAQARRPESLQITLKQRQNQIAQDLAMNFQWPALDLYFELSQDFGEGSDSKKQTELMGGVNFYYPPALRKARGQIQRIESVERSLQLEQAFLQREIAQEINNLWIERKNSCTQVLLAEQEVEVAQKVAEAERQRFALGSSTLFTVNLLEEAVAEARLRYLDALKTYWLAESLVPITLGLWPQG